MNVWTEDLIPKVLPSGYRIIERREDGVALEYRGLRGFHRVIVSAAIEQDGRRWLHLSLSTPKKLPSWELLKEVKQIFIGRNKQAIQVLPDETHYVNIHPNCLHLFHCLDENNPVPDFTRGGKSL